MNIKINEKIVKQNHILFSDFFNCTTQTPQPPLQNTKDGWKSFTGGLYPIITSTDFNADSVKAGALLKTSGGPTDSGRYITREITNAVIAAYPNSYRLRNWNLLQNTGYKPALYVSFYFKTQHGFDLGKLFRAYWDTNKITYPKSQNYWLSVKSDGTFVSRVEGSSDGYKPLYTDKVFTFAEINETWNRFEVMLDFENDRHTFLINGKQMTDVSNGYTGWVTGQLGAGRVLDYVLLGNTVDTRMELGTSFSWAQLYADYSLKRIEIADSEVWANKTMSAVQPTTSWVVDDVAQTTTVEFTPNRGIMPDLNNKWIYYVDGTDATLIGPYVPTL